MTSQIVQTEGVALLVGGAPVGPETLTALAGLSDVVVAADGGAAIALAAGLRPVAVIGDMDSLDPAVAARLDPAQIHRIAEQETTDFDKALRNIAAEVVVGAGFLGARRDHELANFNVLVRHADRPCVLLDEVQVVAVVPPRLEVDLAPGTAVSLFPMCALTGRSTGLRWPIDGLDMAPDGRVGTSNAATGAVRLEMDRPGMLIILPRQALAALLAGLRQAERWPAP